ncbi:hypothetical protein COV16_05105 [Candidatus Woesearchaeota archaeon CG10_big_fil_rev_8_21_14_0_10_34_8]|nr:MAG: hypothetical protein COV16_05105 [Candidatus Woesearchaeota archaeon CG10_big_fil_rev_8_21_14_0_10_34_8]
MDYNRDEAWILLGFSDTNWLTAWLYAEGEQGTESHDYAYCRELCKNRFFQFIVNEISIRTF